MATPNPVDGSWYAYVSILQGGGGPEYNGPPPTEPKILST